MSAPKETTPFPPIGDGYQLALARRRVVTLPRVAPLGPLELVQGPPAAPPEMPPLISSVNALIDQIANLADHYARDVAELHADREVMRERMAALEDLATARAVTVERLSAQRDGLRAHVAIQAARGDLLEAAAALPWWQGRRRRRLLDKAEVLEARLTPVPDQSQRRLRS